MCGERTDWISRTRIIRGHGDEVEFEPFDRVTMFEASSGKSLDELLTDFASLRAANLETLKSWKLDDGDLRIDRTASRLRSGHAPT